MYQDNIEEGNFEDTAPPAPPLAPDFAGPILNDTDEKRLEEILNTINFSTALDKKRMAEVLTITDTTTHQNRLTEILAISNSLERAEALEKYGTFLDEKERNPISKIKSIAEAAKATAKTILENQQGGITAAVKEQNFFSVKKEGLLKISTLGEAQKESALGNFDERIKEQKKKEESCREVIRMQEKIIENQDKIITEADKQLSKIRTKKTAVNTRIALLQGAARPSRAAQVLLAPQERPRSDYEKKMFDMRKIFSGVKAYLPEEVLVLQAVAFEAEDWGQVDHEKRLGDKLHFAINDDQQKGMIGKNGNPRENIRQVLGYDIVDAYETREKEKALEAERQKQALLKEQREIEQKERREKEEAEKISAATPNENGENISGAVGSQGIVQSKASGANVVTPGKRALVKKLEEATQSFETELAARLAEQAARLKSEEEARLAKQEARLKTESEARLAEQLKAEEAAKLTAQAAWLKAQNDANLAREDAQRLREEAQKRDREQRNNLETVPAAEQPAARLTLEQKSHLAFTKRKRQW